MHILEALAQLHQSETVPMAKYIRQEAPVLPWGSTLLVVAAQPSEEMIAVLLDLKRAGRSVALVKVGGPSREGPEPGEGHLDIYYVRDDVAWDLVKEIGLAEK
jgi:hypothetical protein